MFQKLLEQFDCDTSHRIQALFSGIFIQQNRLQTACEKIQTGLTMKQWLLLAMLECCDEPKTLSNVGRLMGCSRQNVKKLADSLMDKGYLTMNSGQNHAVCLEPTGKVEAYSTEMSQRREQALRLLFSDFSEEEIRQLYRLHRKLYTGIAAVQTYDKSNEKEALK